jgi:uridine kinase
VSLAGSGGTPRLIAIAGCSGSGKTTLAEELARELEGTHFHLDHYYRDLSYMPIEERARQNFDHPDQLEHSLLLAHVRELKAGRAIWCPQYDFASHTRLKSSKGEARPEQLLQERHVLLIDGIFALHYPELRALCDVRIYVDAPDDICYQRRLARDVRVRGRSPELVAEHYAATVRPMAEQYVRPSAQYADLVVDGTTSLDWSVEQVLSLLRQRKLLSTGAEMPMGSA